MSPPPPAGVHGVRRVLPGPAPPTAAAWTENETHRLLPPAEPHTHQESTTFLPPKYPKGAPPQLLEKQPEKTKLQKRKEKLVAALRPPYFILSMIVIITGLHIWGSEDLRAQLQWSPDTWQQEPWRLVTYGWVHASALHVALNALVGLAVGWRLEREQGWWRVAAVWGCGVAAGALGAGALQPTVRVVGASAAVYALLTAHLPNVCLRFGYIPLWWFRPLSVVVLATSEASWALLRSGGGAEESVGIGASKHDQVAWAAHIFGAAIGVPLAFLVFTGENASKRHVRWSRAASLAAVAAGGACAVLYYTHCSRAARRLTA